MSNTTSPKNELGIPTNTDIFPIGTLVYYLVQNPITRELFVSKRTIVQITLSDYSPFVTYRLKGSDEIFKKGHLFLTKEDVINNIKEQLIFLESN